MEVGTITRGQQLAARFEALNADAIAAVTACSDEQWQRLTASEGWSVGVVAHHLAEVQGAFRRMVERLAAGETYTPRTSMDAIHESNAQHAREHAAVGKADVLDELHAHGPKIAELLHSLDDAQLARTAGVFGGNDLSVAQVVEFVVIGHAAEHLDSIRATTAD